MANNPRTALLDTAEDVVRTRCFDGFSDADLAEKVGIQKASIHYHFPTNAGLSTELANRYRRTLETRCAQIEQDFGTASARIMALITFYREACARLAMLEGTQFAARGAADVRQFDTAIAMHKKRLESSQTGIPKRLA